MESAHAALIRVAEKKEIALIILARFSAQKQPPESGRFDRQEEFGALFVDFVLRFGLIGVDSCFPAEKRAPEAMSQVFASAPVKQAGPSGRCAPRPDGPPCWTDDATHQMEPLSRIELGHVIYWRAGRHGARLYARWCGGGAGGGGGMPLAPSGGTARAPDQLQLCTTGGSRKISVGSGHLNPPLLYMRCYQ